MCLTNCKTTWALCNAKAGWWLPMPDVASSAFIKKNKCQCQKHLEILMLIIFVRCYLYLLCTFLLTFTDRYYYAFLLHLQTSNLMPVQGLRFCFNHLLSPYLTLRHTYNALQPLPYRNTEFESIT